MISIRCLSVSSHLTILKYYPYNLVQQREDEMSPTPHSQHNILLSAQKIR